MKTKYLLPYLNSSFATKNACAVVRWVVDDVVHSGTVV